jgi:chemotaxis protein CheD
MWNGLQMAEASTDVVLLTGGFHFAEGRVRIRTLLGSCVAVTVWHPTLHIGGMCHYLLPGPRTQRLSAAQGMFAQGAIDLFLKEMTCRRTQPSDYVTKMFGGGRMFADTAVRESCAGPCEPAERTSCRDVPCRNVIEGHDLLARNGFRIAAEDVGGLGSRQLIFDVWSGDVWVRRAPPVALSSGDAA